MSLTVTCRVCRREYEASGDEIIHGLWLRGCPTCRAAGRIAPKPAPKKIYWSQRKWIRAQARKRKT